MADNTKPDESGVTDKPTYPRLHGYVSREESSRWDDVRDNIANTTMVQTQGWENRLYANFPDQLVVSRVRTPDVLSISRK